MEQSIKIFVPLGTQKFPFGRLISAFNHLIEKGIYKPSEIVMQSSVYDVAPLFTHFELIPNSKFTKLIEEAEVIVTHSGVNSIISCMNHNKPLVIVPRQCQYGEHIDDHQLEIANLMEEKYNILILRDMNNLYNMIQQAYTHQYKPWKSQKDKLINDIHNYLESL